MLFSCDAAVEYCIEIATHKHGWARCSQIKSLENSIFTTAEEYVRTSRLYSKFMCTVPVLSYPSCVNMASLLKLTMPYLSICNTSYNRTIIYERHNSGLKNIVCMEHSNNVWLVAEITANAVSFSQDAYGNYVVQYILALVMPYVIADVMKHLEIE
jgi:hypothetical protein